MPITKIDYVDMPFASPRVTPNRGALAALYVRQGENLAELALRKGENKARTFERLGQIYNGYTEQVRQQKAAEAALALRAQEREQDRAETEKDRQMRRDEAKEARRVASERETREAARIMVNDLEPGPQSPVVAELARRYPELAARFSSRETLPATVTPGAAGMVSPDQGTYDVLEPSKDDLERSRANVFRQTQATEAAAARKVDDVRADMAAREALRHNRVVEAQNARGPLGPQPSWQWVTRKDANGVAKEVYTNRVNDGDVPNTNRVKATEDERKTAGFYGQMSDAIALMNELEDNISETELYQIQTLPQEGLIGMANRGELSEAAKRYLRAFEQFTEARLRPVSGAAINDGEYARDRRTYAKQYAETPNLNKDRRQARDRALGSLRKRAGVALDDANPGAGGDAGAGGAGGEMIEAIDPQGNVHHAPAGTPLPKGWKPK